MPDAPSGGWLVWLDPQPAAQDPLKARLDLVQRLGHMGVWELDLATDTLQWDARMYEITGFDPSKDPPARAGALMARVHPHDRTRLAQEIERCAHSAGEHDTRYRLMLPDGGVRDIHEVCITHNGPDGQPRRMTGVLIDETETAQRQRLTEASAQKWLRAIDLAEVSAWHLDSVTGRGYFTASGYRLLGMDPDTPFIPLEALREKVHPDDLDKLMRASDEAMVSGRVIDVEARYRGAHGQYRYLLTRRVAERDHNGEPIGLSGVSLDLTERIAERNRTQAFVQRIDRVTNAAGVGIWSVDMETREIEWNDQMYRLYGVPREQAAPDSRRWLNELVHPDDRDIARGHRPVMGTGPHGRHAEFRVVRPDGSVRWVASWSRRETLGGRDTAFGVNLDITDLQRTQTELRQMQERVRLATESAGIGTWERDLRTDVATWDAQSYRLRGLPVGPEALTPELRRQSAHLSDIPTLASLREHVRHHGDNYEDEFRVVWPDGSVRWLATRGLIKRDAQGEAERLVGVTWDITERRRADQALRDKAAAEQASEAKSQFLARMSHELRTPLNAVLGFAQLMSNDPAEVLSVSQRSRVDRVQSAGLHLLALIDDVLDLATIESDAMPLADEPVSLQRVLDDVLQWTQMQAAQTGVTVQAQAMSGWVRGDPRRVRQIVSNLVSNAIKYNRPGGKVWLSAQACLHQGQPAWTMVIHDTGRGLSPEQRAQLFQPFNRLGAERGSVQGTGIGLAIVHNLVRLMGGEVAVTSAPGEGSEFRVTLPADNQQVVSDHMPLSGFNTDLHPTVPSEQLRVLYIEDNPVNVLLVQELIAMRNDVRLSIAEDGTTGVMLARTEQPQVVLVDMQLPDFDGFEVLRRIRAERSLDDSSIVALSANAMPDDVNRALQAGFDDYWTKPIDFSAFLRSLAALVQKHVHGP